MRNALNSDLGPSVQGKKVQQDVDSLKKMFLITGLMKVPQSSSCCLDPQGVGSICLVFILKRSNHL